ncbi:MAG: S-layer homology domain-containing protein [Clostridiaceae bacterium]|jgi:hypothetical protein|nr:S-layer homology domain-containing protein [Clostridiaceae bacterium]
MRKLFVGALALGLMTAYTVMPSFAANIKDVNANYWASKEINSVVDSNIMSLDKGSNFNPEADVTRVDFVNSLLKLLTNDNIDVTIKNCFSDVKSSDADYSNILRSQQLGLVYGYPDGTFQPKRVMLRDEAQSVISHITKESVVDTAILKNFTDADKVPSWADHVYAKTLAYGIYVNHPNQKELRPTDSLTRAEAAVLLAKLRANASLIQKQYVGADLEKLLAVEHLNVSKKAESNEVKVTNKRNIVMQGNVLQVAFDERFKSKQHQAGDIFTFYNKEDIKTTEGTTVFPANTKFYSKVLSITNPKWFNKNARVYVQAYKAVLPNGQTVALNAKPCYKNYELKEGPWQTAGKLALYTVGGAAVGTGAGVGLAFIPNPDKIGTGIAIGTPVGAAVGLATGLITKGLNYDAKSGEEIYVILLDNASILK